MWIIIHEAQSFFIEKEPSAEQSVDRVHISMYEEMSVMQKDLPRLYLNMIVALYVTVVLRDWTSCRLGRCYKFIMDFGLPGAKLVFKKTPLLAILVMIINNVARTRRIENEARFAFRVIDMYSISHEYEHNALVLLSDCCTIITSYWSMWITITYTLWLLHCSYHMIAPDLNHCRRA